MSDRSRCGAVQMLRSLAQPFRHFVHVRSLSLWHSAVLKIKEILQRDLDNEVCHRELAQILPGGLLKRSWAEIPQRSCQGTFYRDLARGPCIEICCRFCQESSSRELVQISFSGDLAKRPLSAILYRTLAKARRSRRELAKIA